MNITSIKNFLMDRDLGLNTGRLYLENDEILYTHDELNCGLLFAAALGFGSASVSNIADFVNKNRNTLFADTSAINSFNTFIDDYNSKQCICWKTSINIKEFKNIAEIKPAHEVQSENNFSENKEIFNLIKTHLISAKSHFSKGNCKDLLETCTLLDFTLESWVYQNTPETVEAFNQILNLKNQLRSAFYPKKNNDLKGPPVAAMKWNGTDDEKDTLRITLKSIQSKILKNHFQKRLEEDKAKLIELRDRFTSNWDNPSFKSHSTFLDKQLSRWDKKNDEGKPVSIPKWFHCTPTTDVMEKILESYILYAHRKAFGGCFVSNIPEFGEGIYGDNCIAISDLIEKTGLEYRYKNHDGSIEKKLTPDFPTHVPFTENLIAYSDAPIPILENELKNYQEGVSIWFGFQKGKFTEQPTTNMGTKGIPFKRTKRIRSDKPLKYFADTSASFIFSKRPEPALEPIGRKMRLEVLDGNEESALRMLINCTFKRTLPVAYKGNIKRA